MSYRDDFNSSMSSPGNYSTSSNYGSSGYSGNYGGTNNPGMGYQTPAQANFAAQGGSFGPGGGFGSLGAGNMDSLRSLLGQVTSGPIPPALGPQGVPTPRSLPPPVPGQPGFRPSVGTAPQGVPGTTGYFDMREALGYNPSYPPQGIRGGGGVTAINPPGGSGVSAYRTSSPGATYSGMGNDFRSNNFSPSSYSSRW